MSRTQASVKDVMWELARALAREPDPALNAGGITALEQVQMLRCLNTGYQRAYTAAEWEDAWQDGVITPVNGLITYTQLGDARRFTFWSDDPRPVGSIAYPVRGVTSADGVQVQSSKLATVFAFWLPRVVDFTDATSETPVMLECLRAATVNLARAEWMRSNGMSDGAEYYEERGLDLLEQQNAMEFQRRQKTPWRRQQQYP